MQVTVSLNGVDYIQGKRNDTYFEYRSVPSVYHLTPSFGASSGGTNVTVTGSNFKLNQGLHCRFGGVVVPVVAFLSTASVICMAPSHNIGFINVDVMNDYLTQDSRASFSSWSNNKIVRYQYVLDPQLTSIHPHYGSLLGGTTIHIIGNKKISDMEK